MVAHIKVRLFRSDPIGQKTCEMLALLLSMLCPNLLDGILAQVDELLRLNPFIQILYACCQLREIECQRAKYVINSFQPLLIPDG